MTQDPYKYFRIEAAELVGELSKGLIALEKDADVELVARLLRFAHTLKGAARIVKHLELAELAHAMEDTLAPLRDAPVARRHDAAFALVDRMSAQLGTLAAGPAAPAVTAVEVAPIARVDRAALDDALAGISAIHTLLARLQATSSGTLAEGLERIDRELREVRRDVEHARLAPAAAMFTALERTARDAAAASGRRVRFEGRGGTVRIDTQMISALQGALVQLVRNAVVHGIEPPPRRTSARKPSEGRVTVEVKSLGRRIAITVEDDGAGLDVEAIRRAAAKRGIAPAHDATSADIFQLLLRGGISTSSNVTELAGRGVGLDIVRDVAETLGGEIQVQTSAGGTAITLALPISLSALAILIVEAGGRSAAIPQASVRRVARVLPGDLIHTGAAMAIASGDAAVACASLPSLLGGSSKRATTVVYVDADGDVAAVLVDRVLGVDDAVVRAVPAGAPVDPIVAGMSLDVEGQPYPVLEPTALVAAVRRVRNVAPEPEERRLRVLVVDDSLTTRMLEQSILEAAGFEVAVAGSAEQGLDVLGGSSFDAILVDVEMPGMDGFQMIREVRAHAEFARIPAILVTSRDTVEDRALGTAVGANGYVVKGEFDQIRLLEMIRKAVRT